jgi:hypothetical protein
MSEVFTWGRVLIHANSQKSIKSYLHGENLVVGHDYWL